MDHATKKPGDELREKSNKVGSPPKHAPQKLKTTGEGPDELGVTQGQNGEKGNTVNPATIRRGDKASH